MDTEVNRLVSNYIQCEIRGCGTTKAKNFVHVQADHNWHATSIYPECTIPDPLATDSVDTANCNQQTQ